MDINTLIGKKVTFFVAYKRKASSRMKISVEGKHNTYQPQPIFNFSGEGFIIGERRVLMGEAVFHYGSNNPDSCEQSYWSGGTQEQCWLVTQHIRKEPFLVRKTDTTFI